MESVAMSLQRQEFLLYLVKSRLRTTTGKILMQQSENRFEILPFVTTITPKPLRSRIKL